MANTRLRRVRKIAIRLGIAYCVVAIVLSGCASKLILFPSRQPIETAGAQRVEVAGKDGPVEIWTVRTRFTGVREPRAFVLHFVGNASRAEGDSGYVADEWREKPVEIWAVNYPGFGGSAGSATLKSIAPAALAAYDALKQRAGDRPIFISGRSIGTTAALYVAAHRPVNGILLHSPPPLRKLIIGEFGWWNLWLAAIPVALQVPADLDSIENARHSTAPAIFLLSAADTLVPPAYQRKIIDAYGGPKTVIVMEGTGHNDPIPSDALPAMRAGMDRLLPK